LAKILAVDDELGFREALHHTFSQRGHDVMTAINADHAANLMISQAFDLIILDVVMPGESGMDFLKKVRASRNPVPIVVYSVKVDAELEKEARQAGANEVLNKNASLKVLADRCERVFSCDGKPIFSVKDKKKYLLVVDDEKSVRQMLVVFFGKKGYEVIEASSGEEAVDKINAGKPDIVLLDMHMGGMDGIETLTKILQIHPKLGVVMATGDENDQKVREAMELGAYGYVLKPFDFLYLELVVASRLRIAQASDL